ncbi:MAG: hypothetical protein ACO3SO_11145, partial [Luteolibacter sp.]
EWDLDALRKNLALVGQRVMLFDDSIKNNIRMGRLDASDEDVLSAARSSHAWEFIEKLPDQLDTPLGSLGDRLSGGLAAQLAAGLSPYDAASLGAWICGRAAELALLADPPQSEESLAASDCSHWLGQAWNDWKNGTR